MTRKKRETDHTGNSPRRTQFRKFDREDTLEGKVMRVFKEHIRGVKSNELLDKTLFEGLDFDPALRKRRTKAIIETLPKVRTLLSAAVTEHPDVFTLENDWIDINTLPMTGYDLQEKHTCSTLAAAIWILDQLEREGEIRCLDFLADPAPEYEPPLTKSVWDVCHSPDLIESIRKAIYSRNGDPLQTHDGKGGISRLYISERIADGSADRISEQSSAYHLLLAHIPRQTIDDAVAHYEQVYWDWVSRYFLSRNILAQQEIHCFQQLQALEKEVKASVVNRGVLQDTSARIDVPNLASGADLSQLLSILPGQSPPPMTKLANTARGMDMRKISLEQAKSEASVKIDKLWYFAGFLPKWTYGQTARMFGKEIADIWKDFDTGDPYEMAFAFLYLLDSGADLPWCYFPGVNLHLISAAKLPWTRLYYNPLNDGIFCHYDPADGAIKFGPSESALSKQSHKPALEDWYELRYTDREDENSERYNLAQIIYTITGCIMPRRLDRYMPALATLDRYGITGEHQKETLLYCMTLLGDARYQRDGDYSELEIIDEDDACLNEDPADTIEALQMQIAALKEDLARQKQQAYESSREARDMRLRYESMAQLAANDRQELYDLRELIFRQQEGSYEDAAPSDDISFPYSSSNRIVVFGGHDSWVREIRLKLPTVRFVDRTAAPNSNMIRNTDIIWIQTNALSHPRFYKIVDEAKKYNVPIRYFSFASPIKCAEQLIREDRKTKK